MTVSMVKPVSLVRRPRAVLPAVREGAVSLAKPVNLAKRNPVVRSVRFHLRSYVLAYVDVAQRRDGTVWYAARRRDDVYGRIPGRVVWTRVYKPFWTAMSERYESEQRVGCFRYMT